MNFADDACFYTTLAVTTHATQSPTCACSSVHGNGSQAGIHSHPWNHPHGPDDTVRNARCGCRHTEPSRDSPCPFTTLAAPPAKQTKKKGQSSSNPSRGKSLAQTTLFAMAFVSNALSESTPWSCTVINACHRGADVFLNVELEKVKCAMKPEAVDVVDVGEGSGDVPYGADPGYPMIEDLVAKLQGRYKGCLFGCMGIVGYSLEISTPTAASVTCTEILRNPIRELGAKYG